MSKNDVTGDALRTKFGDEDAVKNYNEGYDRIFGKKNKVVKEQEETIVDLDKDLDESVKKSDNTSSN